MVTCNSGAPLSSLVMKDWFRPLKESLSKVLVKADFTTNLGKCIFNRVNGKVHSISYDK